MRFREALAFDDVLLVPQYFKGTSRKDINISTKISGLKLQVPIISANMATITEYEMCLKMSKLGGLGILHRMNGIDYQIRQLEKYHYPRPLLTEQKNNFIGASIGIGETAFDDAQRLIEAGASLICIDVAHADQPRTYELYYTFRKKFSKFPLIIGNYASPSYELEMWNDPFVALKLGVGSGAMCTTRIQTGCGLPSLQSMFDFKDRSEAKDSCSFILDGGIKNSGDIVKSLAAGAHCVMIGSLLSATPETPGEIYNINGVRKKLYAGNASAVIKRSQTNSMTSEFVEGEDEMVDVKEPVEVIVKRLCDGIRSGFSYCGAISLKELQNNAKFVKISQSGHRESQPHGKL